MRAQQSHWFLMWAGLGAESNEGRPDHQHPPQCPYLPFLLNTEGSGSGLPPSLSPSQSSSQLPGAPDSSGQAWEARSQLNLGLETEARRPRTCQCLKMSFPTPICLFLLPGHRRLPHETRRGAAAQGLRLQVVVGGQEYWEAAGASLAAEGTRWCSPTCQDAKEEKPDRRGRNGEREGHLCIVAPLT